MTPEDLDHWGRCPHCGGNDGYLNVGRAHWFACNRHRTKWCAGENLFSAWRREPSSVHRENAERLATYEEVRPLHRPPHGDANAGTDRMKPPLPVDSIIAVVDYLDEHERSDFRGTPAEDRPYHVYRHVLELRRWLGRLRRAWRRQSADRLLQDAHGRAMDAALLLVAAYRNGRLDGGHVDWSDVDAAHEVAREAAALAARHRRQRRRAEPRSPG